MANIENINVGLAANDKKGDPLRDAMQKANRNFSALNTAIQGVLDGKGQASGYASLGTDGRLLAAQAPIVYAPTLPTTTHDLNTYVTPGTFYQAAVAGATAPTGVNYPVAQVGFLEVIATGNPVQHVYTTREASPRRFWRSKYGTSAWSSWKEASDVSTTLAYQGSMATGQDLNNYTQRGMWAIASSSVAAGGTNFPIGNSGTLIVYSAGYPGGAAANNVNQVYFASNTGQTFTRSLVTTTWTPWVRSVDSSQLGAPSGAATLNAAGQLVQNSAPARALGASENLNDITAPGSYYMNSNASATAALNYPVLLAGLLEVEAAVSGNVQVVQRYTTNPATNPRVFMRIRFNAVLTWGAWFELARADLAMTNVVLTAATDANTLTTANTSYSFRTGIVAQNGTNWPPTSNFIGGSVDVVVASDLVIQTATFPVSNGKPRIFQRYAISGVWQTWKALTPISTTGWLPTADAGDVYVDNVGWHRWNGTAYEMSALAPWLPTAAHDLNNYTTPGEFCQSSTAGAAAGTNYPVAIGGFLKVTQGAGINGTVQEYTVRSAAAVSASAGPRRYWRVRDGSSWSPWQEVLTTALGMTHIFLTAATDANTLTADNTFYTWTASAVASGANFPGYSAAGYMQVFWQAATVVSQELTLLVTGGKPLKFARFGNTSTGVWQPWKVTSSFNSANWMPSSNMGDISVDGALGVYRWSSVLSAYVPTPPTPSHREGLKTVWGGFTTISVNPGRCASAGGDVLLELPVVNTRTLQTSGAFVHSNTGNGLLTGSRVANTWYYVFLLRRNSDGAICVAFDTTVNCANRPATHTHYRRVGCTLTDSSNNLWAFIQYGNEFWLDVKFVLFSGASLTADTTYTPSTYTPPNVAHTIRFTGFLTTIAGNNAALMTQYRQGSRQSEWSYVLVTSPSMNTVNDWEIPMQAVASPTVNFQIPSVSGAASVFIKGYVDLFED